VAASPGAHFSPHGMTDVTPPGWKVAGSPRITVRPGGHSGPVTANTPNQAFSPSTETVEFHVRNHPDGNDFLLSLRRHIIDRGSLTAGQVAAAGRLIMRDFRLRRLNPDTFNRLKRDFDSCGLGR